MREYLKKVVAFRDKHIWPFSTISTLQKAWKDEANFANEMATKNAMLMHDLAEVGQFLGRYGLDFKNMEPDGTRAIRIAYSMGNVKAGVTDAPPDRPTRDKSLTASYVYSKPEVYHYREEVDSLVFEHKLSSSILFGNAIEEAVSRFREDLAAELKDKLVA